MRWLIGTLAAVGTAGLLPAADKPDPRTVAGRIDHHVTTRLNAVGVKPAPLADDARFLRRTYLLLVGRVPTPAEVHAFLGDPDADKRAKLIDRLMATPGYANHFTAVWRGWLLPEAQTNFELAAMAPMFEAWLRPKVRDNVPFSRLVKDLLTTPVAPPKGEGNQNGFDPYSGGASPLPFYYAKAAKPENLAAATARVFLGVQLECAQCHNHPFARWSREQFWGLAAFFAGIQATQPDQPYYSPLREVSDRRELAIPNTDDVVQATFLDDTEPDWKPRTSSRVTLAEWMTKPGNPFFAKAYVNRMWGYVFGVGIVEPVDDFSDENKPTHPELLNELAKAFEASGYDQRFLLRAILNSQTYQRDSAQTEPGQSDVRLFARFPVQGLSPEQLYDSLATVLIAGRQPANPFEFQNPQSPRRQFLEKFALTGKRTEAQTSILQALTLMNGDTVGRATAADGGRLVAAVVELPGLSDEERIEAIYLAALGRRPTAKEQHRALEHARAGWLGSKNRRYGDLLWALLNSAEFRTNH